MTLNEHYQQLEQFFVEQKVPYKKLEDYILTKPEDFDKEALKYFFDCIRTKKIGSEDAYRLMMLMSAKDCNKVVDNVSVGSFVTGFNVTALKFTSEQVMNVLEKCDFCQEYKDNNTLAYEVITNNKTEKLNLSTQQIVKLVSSGIQSHEQLVDEVMGSLKGNPKPSKMLDTLVQSVINARHTKNLIRDEAIARHLAYYNEPANLQLSLDDFLIIFKNSSLPQNTKDALSILFYYQNPQCTQLSQDKVFKKFKFKDNYSEAKLIFGHAASIIHQQEFDTFIDKFLLGRVVNENKCVLKVL